ncbi:IPT/TIG domain-containing protein [bacterium]|nr:IPT/TIG domain-containing protein [bacterium]RQV97482.1 MAG: hypothetical protein EH221_03630 [bacterium]
MKSTIKILITLTAVLLVMAGCEYDGPTAMYDRPYEETDPPVITSVDPPEAVAGVNFITIYGENFSETLDSNKVYVDGFLSEIVDFDTSFLTIRRPNRTGDSTVIKVVNYETIGHATHSPYKILPVYERYGGFIENAELTALAVSSNGDLYVAQGGSPRVLYHVSSDGSNKTLLGETSRGVTDMKMAPDGKLVLLCNNKSIYKFNVEEKLETEWLSQDERVSFGDFDADGNFYAGGRKTGIVVIKPDLSVATIDLYSNDEIFCMRMFNDALYLLVQTARPDEATPEMAVWRHPIQDANGTLGEKELVVDWAVFEANEESVPIYFTISKEGVIYLSSDDVQSVYSYDMHLQVRDILYKGILPAGGYCLSWGIGNDLYMVQGEDIEGNEVNDLIRIDMGTSGAPYYGWSK